jgi:hypothetical protein
MVRGTIEETLNAMLDAGADRLCGAGRYERNEVRQDTWAGNYDRNAANQGRQNQSEGSETAAPDLRLHNEERLGVPAGGPLPPRDVVIGLLFAVANVGSRADRGA